MVVALTAPGAVIVGGVTSLMVNTIGSIPSQLPEPLAVNFSVTEPAVISAEEGVYVVDGEDGLANVPVPVVVHAYAAGLPEDEPLSVAVAPGQMV